MKGRSTFVSETDYSTVFGGRSDVSETDHSTVFGGWSDARGWATRRFRPLEKASDKGVLTARWEGTLSGLS